MGSLEQIVTILGLPIASGLNLYATVLVLGLGQRYGWITGLPDELAILSNPIVLGVAGVLYAVEFFADKIPYVDTLWDGLHTLIRPAGAAYLALQAAGDYGPEGKIVAMLAGGALGLGAHSTKAGTRLLVNTSPEPASNSIVSLLEDFGVVGLLALMYSYPWIALGVLVAIIAVMAIVTPILFRLIRFLLGGVAGVLGSWFGSPNRALPNVPNWIRKRLPDPNAKPHMVPCYARNIPEVRGFQRGYLVVSAAGLQFAYQTLLTAGVVPLGESRQADCTFQKRVLFDVVTIESRRRALICVPKNWSPTVQAELGIATGAPQYAAARNP